MALKIRSMFQEIDVLNGIAWDEENDRLFGKSFCTCSFGPWIKASKVLGQLTLPLCSQWPGNCGQSFTRSSCVRWMGHRMGPWRNCAQGQAFIADKRRLLGEDMYMYYVPPGRFEAIGGLKIGLLLSWLGSELAGASWSSVPCRRRVVVCIIMLRTYQKNDYKWWFLVGVSCKDGSLVVFRDISTSDVDIDLNQIYYQYVGSSRAFVNGCFGRKK